MKKVLKYGLVSLAVVVPMFAKMTEVDALILYSNGADARYNGDAVNRIEQLINTTNKIYKDSTLDIKLNPVKIMKYSALDDSKKSSEVLAQIQKDKNIKKIRDEVGADEVIIYRPYAHDGVCGIAYLNKSLASAKSAKYAKEGTYAHVTIDCGGYVTAHEVGHNMGLGHSYKQHSVGAFKYARGHGVQNEFTTVMAYKSTYNGKKIYKFSSPKLDCNGLPCGVPEGNDDEADAVKALTQTVPLLAELRVHKNTNSQTIDNNDNSNNTTNSGNGNDLESIRKAFLAEKKVYIKVKKELRKYATDFKQKNRKYKKELGAYYQLAREYKAKKVSYSDIKSAYDKLIIDYNGLLKSFRNYKDFYLNHYIVEREKLVELYNEYKEIKANS